MSVQTFRGLLAECAKEHHARLSALWRQEAMTRAEVAEVQRLEQLLSQLRAAGVTP